MKPGRLLIVALLAVGCTTEIDLTGLAFPTPGTGDTQSPPEDLDDNQGPLLCAEFYACVVHSDAQDPLDACEDRVLETEEDLLDDVEKCRTEVCQAPNQDPETAQWDPAAMMACLMKGCWSPMTSCAVTQGSGTCEAFADQWLALTKGDTPCPQPALELCIIDAMAQVDPARNVGVHHLLDCLNTEYAVGTPFETCKQRCAQP